MQKNQKILIDWYHPNDIGIVFKIKRKIIEKKTKYQKVEVYESTKFGEILMIDGLIQSVERWEESYHESLVHPSLFIHPDPEDILIIGGGEGATLREVLKHPVKKAKMVDIDGEVVEIARKYLKFDRGAFKDKRAEVIIEDGFKFLKETDDLYDVIIMDATDPGEEPSNPLYTEEFFNLCFNSLKKNGIFVTQGGTPIFLNHDRIKNVYEKLKKVFKNVKVYKSPVFGLLPDWVFFIATKGKIKVEKKPKKEIKIPLIFYTPEIHQSLFSLPLFLQQFLDSRQ